MMREIILCLLVVITNASVRIPAEFSPRGYLSISVLDPTSNNPRLIELDSQHTVAVRDGSLVSTSESSHPSQTLMNSLVSIFESVSISRNGEDSFEIFLNSTDDEFSTLCVADSIITIPMFGGVFGHRLAGIAAPLLPIVAIEFLPTLRKDFVVEVPVLYHHEIMSRLPPVGNYSPYRIVTFIMCHRDQVLPLLEDIVISTADGHSIRISPDDYMEFLDDGTCKLKVVDTCNDAIFPVLSKFNPLAIPNINVRRTRNSIAFCDSVV